MTHFTTRILCLAGLPLLVFGLSVAKAAEYQRGAMMRGAQLYISPDPTSAKLSDVERGREVVTGFPAQSRRLASRPARRR